MTNLTTQILPAIQSTLKQVLIFITTALDDEGVPRM